MDTETTCDLCGDPHETEDLEPTAMLAGVALLCARCVDSEETWWGPSGVPTDDEGEE